ncbi:mechanosensitive ion channel family protein [Luteimonas aquatica]|uniref:mechanosensitive ion channel family protein n=1 Tax=Luteimonas aquatica TaxID=450364 RepID=UPI001F587437|nr:mechanosensitive ion channel family protein [Luteimonas aquatica]
MDSWIKTLQGSEWGAIALTWGLRLLAALLLLLIGLRVAKWVAALVERALTRAQLESTAVQFLRKAVYVILAVVLGLAALQTIGVPMTSMLAVLGAAGLAIGLALKDSLSNIASGVMLVTLKPFRVGNIVTIAGETGQVEAVSIFQTTLRGADNQTIVLPNSLITSDSIINLTPDVMRRIELVVGIGYQDDIGVARAAALREMQDDRRILAKPAPNVLVYALADNSVNLGIRCHVGNDDYFVTKCELTERIKQAFDRLGISIPFPQRDVHVYHHASEGEPALQPAAGGLAPARLEDRRHEPSGDPE